MNRCCLMVMVCLVIVANLYAGDACCESSEKDKMAWWTDARFGMFIHWGPSSLTGREISWSRKMPRPGCGHPKWGTLPIELYDNLYLIFNPVNFDAEKIVQIAQDAGMKYLVFTTKHHDGFCNFDASNTGYKITSPASPFRRDIVKELADACHKNSLKLGLYYSQPDWQHPDYLTENHDQYIEYFHQHVRDLLTNYGKVDIIWFDGLGLTKEQLNSEVLFKTIRELQPDILINNRCGLPGDFDTPEQQVGAFQIDRPWESCITIGDQWSWKPNDRVNSLKECIRTLVNCAGGDGNLLFNVGPTPLGEIEPLQVERLKEMGDWLDQYGQSIYGTRGGPYMPGDYGVSTCKENKIYIHILDWQTGTIKLPAPPAKIKKATLLTSGKVKLNTKDDKIEIRIKKKDRDQIDTIVMLEIDQDATQLKPISTMPESIAVGCKAIASNVHGNNDAYYGADKAFDGDSKTRWATDGGTEQAWIEVDLGQAKTINRVIVFEEHGHRTQQFELLGFSDGQWQTLAEGTTMGHKKDLKFDPVKVSKLKLDIQKASEGPTISEIYVLEPVDD